MLLRRFQTPALYAREDVVTTIVTTYPESVGYTVTPATSIETVITGETTGITIAGTETTASVNGYNTHTTVAESAYTFSCTSDAGSSCNELTETTFYWPTDTPIVISYAGTTQYFELSEATTAVLEVSDITTDISTEGISTQVTIEGITTSITVSSATTFALTVSATTTSIHSTIVVTVPDDQRVSDSSYTTSFTISPTTIYFNVAAVSTTVSLEGVTTDYTQITTLTLDIPESTSFFVSEGMVSSYVTTIPDSESSESSSSEESTSDTTVSSSEECKCEECWLLNLSAKFKPLTLSIDKLWTRLDIGGVLQWT